MPTYEYACAACGHEWEQTQRITEPAVEVCPVCAKPTAHRLISAGTNFILKGGGWYSDLYASPKAAAAEKPENKSEKKGEKADANAATPSTTPGKAAPAEAPGKATKPTSTESSSTSSSGASSSSSSPAPSSSAPST
jgi:putative FmdB family regulatory protein